MSHRKKHILRFLKKTLLAVFGFVVLYITAVFVLPLIVLSGNTKTINQEDNTIAIYIISNGMHTDIVLPVRNETKDWSKMISYQDIISKDTIYQYISFGWGDQGAFLDMPTWNDLTIGLAAKAAFGLGTTAMHTQYYKYALQENEDCKKIQINPTQYQNLVAFINKRFKTDANGKIINIKTNAQYSNTDAFYEANGRYSIFYSCNTWANNALKAANQKHCLWTVLSKPLLKIM